MRLSLLFVVVWGTFSTALAADDFAIRGRCLSEKDRTAIKGANVQLILCHGVDAKPEFIASTETGDDGAYRFDGLAWPRALQINPQNYYLLVDATDRALMLAKAYAHSEPGKMLFQVFDRHAPVTGRVVDHDGNPFSAPQGVGFNVGVRFSYKTFAEGVATDVAAE